MKRYSMIAATGTGTDADLIRPLGLDSTGFVVVAQRGQWMLVKHRVPDGTAPASDTLVDLGPDGQPVATALGAAARTAIKTWLTNHGLDPSQFDVDGVDDRRKLLRFVLRRLMLTDFDESNLSGWDFQ